jgi:hypothetical protein
MVENIGNFMAGLIVTIGQASLFGLVAIWLGSRRRIAVRLLGALLILALAWTSMVDLVNRFSGYVARSDVDSNLAAIAGLGLGWLAGRSRRHAALEVQPDNASSLSRSDKVLQVTGAWIRGVSQGYGVVGGLFATAVVLGLVADLAGFWGVVLGFVGLPATFTVAPFYAGFRLDNWTPAFLTYGTMLSAFLGWTFGSLVAEAPDRGVGELRPNTPLQPASGAEQ